MHRIGRVGRYKNVGSSFVIYKQDSDAMINRLTKKKINFHFYLLKNDKMIDKPLKLRIIKKRMFDKQTNDKIKTIYNLSKNKVKPGYKKKMKKKIEKIKQKVKHEYIEKKIKQSLLRKNIEENKKLLKKKK
jgi:ATP-dependent RNA helicase CshB